jgi:hypothetical protein
MNERSRGWRRWVSGAAFLLAVGFLSTRTCRSESASAEVRFVVGAGGARLERLEAELYRPGEQELLGYYRRFYERGRGSGAEAGRWPFRADGGMYRMKIALATAAGVVRVERALELEDRAVITIDLEHDLEPDPAR